MKRLAVVAATFVAFAQLVFAPATLARTTPLLEFHLTDYHGSVKWGGVELYSNGLMIVCDDHSDGVYIVGTVHNYSDEIPNNGVPASSSQIVSDWIVRDDNGHTAPCAHGHDIPDHHYIADGSEIEVSIFEEAGPDAPFKLIAHQGGAFRRTG